MVSPPKRDKTYTNLYNVKGVGNRDIAPQRILQLLPSAVNNLAQSVLAKNCTTVYGQLPHLCPRLHFLTSIVLFQSRKVDVMKESHWRETANRVIRQVVEANPNATNDQLRQLAGQAYPFGPRKYHPYKIWLDELNQMIPRNGKRVATADDVRNLWLR